MKPCHPLGSEGPMQLVPFLRLCHVQHTAHLIGSPFYRCCCSWWWAHGPGISKMLGSPPQLGWLLSLASPGLFVGIHTWLAGAKPQLFYMTPQSQGYTAAKASSSPIASYVSKPQLLLITPSRLQNQYHLWNFKLQN